MSQLVLIRHGESLWNKENKFTGWTDVDLSETGYQEAERAGRLLKEKGFVFDLAFTSVLKRAIRTLFIICDEMDCLWLPTVKAWELNERHYGALQGLNKAEMAQKFGDDQVFIWRRSFDVQPPAMEPSDSRHPSHDRRYRDVAPSLLPGAEALADTIKRVIPYWQHSIVPALRSGQRVLIAAHGNSLRALVKHLDQISDEEIMQLNIPTGIPLVYELDRELRPVQRSYLGDAAAIQAATDAVAQQGKSSPRG